MSSRFIRCLVITAVFGLCLMGNYGCQSVGSGVKQDASGVTLDNPGPNTLAQTDSDGQWTVSATGPVQQTTVSPDGTISSIGGALASREVVIPIEGVPVVMRSGSDISIKAAKVFSPSTGKTVVEGLELSTVTSTPQRAANEALDRWVQERGKLNTEQRKALEAQTAAWLEGVKAISPTLAGLLEKLLAP